MITSTLSLLSWVLTSDRDCGPELLRQAWATAQATKDMPTMAVIAKHENVPADLDVKISAISRTAVRLAHLQRPGLSQERVRELLVGETRSAVLGELLGLPQFTWLQLEIERSFVARPGLGLAKLLLACSTLEAATAEAIVGQLIPNGRSLTTELTSAQLSSLVLLCPTVTTPDARGALLEALTRQAEAGKVAIRDLKPLLVGPLPAPVLERFGATLIGLIKQGRCPRNSYDLPWAGLFSALIGHENLPDTILALIGKERQGRQNSGDIYSPPAALLLLPEGVRGDASGSAAALLGADPDTLTAAVCGPLTTLERMAVLLNPLVSEAQAALALDKLVLSPERLTQLVGVGPDVQYLLLRADPAAVLAAFGWCWFDDPLAAQQTLIRRANQPLDDMPKTHATQFAWLLSTQLVAPMLPRAWRELQAGTVRATLTGSLWSVRHMGEADHVGVALGQQMNEQLGTDQVAWATFSALLPEFTGTFGELLDLSVELADIPPSPLPQT